MKMSRVGGAKSAGQAVLPQHSSLSEWDNAAVTSALAELQVLLARLAPEMSKMYEASFDLVV